MRRLCYQRSVVGVAHGLYFQPLSWDRERSRETQSLVVDCGAAEGVVALGCDCDCCIKGSDSEVSIQQMNAATWRHSLVSHRHGHHHFHLSVLPPTSYPDLKRLQGLPVLSQTFLAE